ncbi:EF-hand domain-containing protein [Pseudomonas tructae]|uniref:EF-hand domain-containing protein n=2 Tax=Pseudomonas tructae TaxID=2518644 RepID=A0A411MFS5_9PSED|nr:EF-hand domain-containing protein [Pseudomonas tructae]
MRRGGRADSRVCERLNKGRIRSFCSVQLSFLPVAALRSSCQFSLAIWFLRRKSILLNGTMTMTELTDDQLDRAKKAFDSLDSNCDGKVKVAEFVNIAERYFEKHEIEQLLKEANPNNDDEISFEEFLEDYKKDL